MQEREDFIHRVKGEMKEWQAKLEPLRLQTKLGSMEARDRMHELEATAKEKFHDVETKLHEIREESGEAWKSLAHGCEKSWDETKASLKAAIARFRE